MIRCNTSANKKVSLYKLKNGKHTYSSSCRRGDSFIFVFKAERSLGITDVYLTVNNARYSFIWRGIDLSYESYTLDISELVLNHNCHFNYDVVIQCNNEVYRIDSSSGTVDNDSIEYLVNRDAGRDFIFTIESDFKTGYISGCIYHIFVDRFNKSYPKIRSDSRYCEDWENGIPEFAENNGDFILNNTHFGGNFQGIIEKLDYLSSLSVEYIYLSPISKAFSNHKYDVGSYFDIDENFGGESKFKELTDACHSKGIKIILDCVFNHTGDDSVYFNKYGKYESIGAYQSKSSKYYGWYTFYEYPDKYSSWWGIGCLPAIKKGCEEFISFICDFDGVIDYYMKLGVDAVRLDVADELTLDFIKKIKDAVLRNNENGIVIGEVWENATRKNAYGEDKYYLDSVKLDSVTNYPLMNAIIDFAKDGNTNGLKSVLAELLCDYPERNQLLLMNILSTHDTKRFISRFTSAPTKNSEKAVFKMTDGEYHNSIEKLKNALVIQAFIIGTPCIYYGDEIGMQGLDDPFNRMPMKWNNVDVDLLEWYKKVLNIRKKYRPLHLGGMKIVYLNNGVFIFDRYTDEEAVRIIVNQSKKAIRYKIDGYSLFDECEVNEITVQTNKSACIKLYRMRTSFQGHIPI